MNRLTQHIPNYVEQGNVRETKVAIFENQYLKEISFVKSFMERKDFFQPSVSDYILMAEFDKGLRWYAIGYFDKDIPELPRWTPPSHALNIRF